jgi:hypothetical protein
MESLQNAPLPAPKSGVKSWHPLWKPVLFLVFVMLLFGYRAANENDTASRQQTSSGTILQCEARGRWHQTYCRYIFPVGDREYTSQAPADYNISFGQPVVVYYDSQSPEVSALDDFNKQSRQDRNYFYISLLVLAGFIAIILWNRTPKSEYPVQRISS